MPRSLIQRAFFSQRRRPRLPATGLAAGVGLGEGGVEVGANDELALQDLDRQVLLDDLAEEAGAAHDQRLLPEAGRQRHRPRRRQQAIAVGVHEDVYLGDDTPVVGRPDLVPGRAAAERPHLVAEVVAGVEGEVLVPQAPHARRKSGRRRPDCGGGPAGCSLSSSIPGRASVEECTRRASIVLEGGLAGVGPVLVQYMPYTRPLSLHSSFSMPLYEARPPGGPRRGSTGQTYRQRARCVAYLGGPMT